MITQRSESRIVRTGGAAGDDAGVSGQRQQEVSSRPGERSGAFGARRARGGLSVIAGGVVGDDRVPEYQHRIPVPIHAAADAVSWTWWAYCGCDDPTTSGPGNVQAIVKDPRRPPNGSNVIRRKLALLERPYPQVIAGTPTSFSYDPASGVFRFTYSTRTPEGRVLPRRSKTSVYVPRRHYPDGYDVRAQGASVASKPNSQHLVLKRREGAARVTLTVTPSP
jgi:hypothetical protein